MAEINEQLGVPGPYSAAQGASETSQAQQSMANDMPVDVNNNAALARTQANTTMLAGAEFEAAAARRTIFADKDVRPGTP